MENQALQEQLERTQADIEQLKAYLAKESYCVATQDLIALLESLDTGGRS